MVVPITEEDAQKMRQHQRGTVEINPSSLISTIIAPVVTTTTTNLLTSWAQGKFVLALILPLMALPVLALIFVALLWVYKRYGAGYVTLAQEKYLPSRFSTLFGK